MLARIARIARFVRYRTRGVKVILTIDQESSLTVREQQILYHIARGLSNRGIAARLALSEQTVKVHLANMIAKTGCDNRAALVAYGFETGVLKAR